eukprot:UN07916
MSSSAERVRAIEERNEKEVKHLIEYMKKLGKQNANGDYEITFGELFKNDEVANLFEGLSATCKICKQRGYLSYASPLLLQGAHDNVVLTLNTAKCPTR